MLSRSVNSYTSLLIFALLTACSGGGGTGNSSTTNSTAGMGGNTESFTSLSSIGVITGFGSVYLNGERYEVENDTVVSIEDESETTGDDSRLRLGMKIRMRARENDNGERFAERIEFDDDLKGPVRDVTADVNDPAIGTFKVLRLTVIVDANTIFNDNVGDNNADENIDINDLAPGTGQVVVQISGFHTGNGILATRIDRLNPPDGGSVDENAVKVKGTITDINGLPVSFQLNNELTVNLNGTVFRDGLVSSADLRVNQFVEVKGTRISDGIVEAGIIELEARIVDGNPEGEIEIEGVLVSVNTTGSPHVVVVNGISIRVVDARSISALVGKRIELKGEFNADGVLVLHNGQDGVKTEAENSFRTFDLLAAVDTPTDTLNTRLGLQITPTGLSRVEDETRDIANNLHLDDFINGLQGKGTSAGVPVLVEARGYPEGDRVIWTRVEIGRVEQDRGQVCMLRGPVHSVNRSDFTFKILNVTVHASAAIGGEVVYRNFHEDSGQILTRDEFFARLEQGLVVRAIGNTERVISSADCARDNLTADEVEFRVHDEVFGTVSSDDGLVDDDNPEADKELAGAASNINNDARTFSIAGHTVQVTPATLIDNRLIAAARGEDVIENRAFEGLPESLSALLTDQLIEVHVLIDGDKLVALSIEAIN